MPMEQLLVDAPNIIRYPFRKNIRPGWVGDFLSREHVLAGGVRLDPSLFEGDDAALVTVTTYAGSGSGGGESEYSGSLSGSGFTDGAADSGDTAINVVVTMAPAAVVSTPPPVVAPAGTILNFGVGKYARLRVNLASTDTLAIVEALPAGLTVGDVARVLPPNTPKRVASGTVIGWTNAELEAAAAMGLQMGPAGDGDDQVRLIAYDVIIDLNNAIARDFPMDSYNIRITNEADLLRPGTLIYVNFLPNFAGLSSAVKTKIRATYECSVGAPGQEVAYS